MVHFLVESLVDFSCTFVRDFSFNVHFEEVGDCGLKFCLDEPELLIDLVPENFSEHTNIIILPWIGLDSRNNTAGCLDCQILD